MANAKIGKNRLPRKIMFWKPPGQWRRFEKWIYSEVTKQELRKYAVIVRGS